MILGSMLLAGLSWEILCCISSRITNVTCRPLAAQAGLKGLRCAHSCVWGLDAGCWLGLSMWSLLSFVSLAQTFFHCSKNVPRGKAKNYKAFWSLDSKTCTILLSPDSVGQNKSQGLPRFKGKKLHLLIGRAEKYCGHNFKSSTLWLLLVLSI